MNSNLKNVYVIIFMCLAILLSDGVEFDYLSNAELSEFLQNFTSTSKLNTTLFSIGNSVSGIPLSVVEINQPGATLGVPNIKFIGNVHGNEVSGRVLLLAFLVYLEERYSANPLVKCLVDNTRIFILPSMNPDGFEKTPEGNCEGIYGRLNNNGIDLNGKFPDYFHDSSSQRERSIQPEIEAMMNWLNSTSFVLSASIHGGALVASYPYHSYHTEDEREKRLESKTPDHDVFVHLARTYSKYHEKMREGVVCPGDDSTKRVFPDGITNGAQWFNMKGSMQDYNYINHGVMELSLQLSCCKYPSLERLPALFQENIESLLHFSLQALRGVKGLLLDKKTNNPIGNATLKIKGREMTFRSSQNGEFWRVLLPGTYEINVEAPGYRSESQRVTVQDFEESECPHTNMTIIYMTPDYK